MKRGFAPIAIVGCIGCAIVFAFLGIGLMAGLGYMVALDGGGGGEVSVVDSRTDISNEEWLEIFKRAETELGTPWELTAAILCKESSCGKNFGSCSYFPPAPSGGSVLAEEGSPRIRSTEDRSAFERIVDSIGYQKNEPVSCGSPGGAMGYMQMMPKEWEGGSNAIVSAGIASGALNPWNAQEAAYVSARLIKCKAWEVKELDQAFCSPEIDFPETELYIKRAADCYLGCGNGTTYADDVYASYLEYKAAGRIVE